MGWKVGLTVPGAALRAHREALGHSQRDAARIMDTHHSVLSRWENSDVAAISTRHADAVRSYLARSPDHARMSGRAPLGRAERPGCAGLGPAAQPCTPATCERYHDCVALQRAGLWTLCELEPPTLPDLLRYDRLVHAGALDAQSVQFPTEEGGTRLTAPARQPTADPSVKSVKSVVSLSTRPL